MRLMYISLPHIMRYHNFLMFEKTARNNFSRKYHEMKDISFLYKSICAKKNAMRLVSALLRNVLSPKSRRHQSLDVDAYKSATALVCHQTSAYIKRSKVSHDFFPFFFKSKIFQ